MKVDLFKADLDCMPENGWLIGVDEVGRGPLAGPVVAAVVALRADGLSLLQRHEVFKMANDSKQMSEKKRKLLDSTIQELIEPSGGLQVGCASASVREIDQRNILGATRLAMYRALKGVEARLGATELPEPESDAMPLFEKSSPQACRILLDGNPLKEFPYAHEGVVKGDQKHLCIALASIVAKVFRDQWMVDCAPPGDPYAWSKNKGYGTQAHIAAIRRHGVHSEHRALFLRKITGKALAS